MNIIEFDNVSFEYTRYDEENDATVRYTALTDISLQIKKGEFIAVMGHNGSGKSTFAKLINALLLPGSGRITVNGISAADGDANIYAIRAAAGMVFQNPDNQLVASVVEEDIAFGPQNLGLPPLEIKKRVQNALAAVGMSDFAQRPTFALSGGQKQKIAIAGVLAMEPSVIILDEPTAMLDPSGRRDVMETTLMLNKQKGITVIFITHFMHEAAAADRAVVMDKGYIVKDAPPAEVFLDPRFLRGIGLDVPHIPDLAHRLREGGFDIPKDTLTIAQLKEALCCLKHKT